RCGRCNGDGGRKYSGEKLRGVDLDNYAACRLHNSPMSVRLFRFVSDHCAVCACGFEPDNANIAEANLVQPSAVFSWRVVPATNGFHEHIKAHERGGCRSRLIVTVQSLVDHVGSA